MIPRGVKGWPAKGNEYFFEINEFDLPNTTQGLAGFFDRNGDTNYDPLDGDSRLSRSVVVKRLTILTR
jgi:hypothetical protein